MAFYECMHNGVTITVCDFANLNSESMKKARIRLRNAYGESDTPDFENCDAFELSSWCENMCVNFELDGYPLWTDDSSIVLTQLHYETPDTGEELFAFADLPDDDARSEAVVWMWEEQMFSEEWDDVEPEEIPFGVAMSVANNHELLWDCSGIVCAHRDGHGIHEGECRVRTY